MGKAPKTPAPPVPDLERDILSYVSGVSKALPTTIGFEQQYRPQFQGLNLGDISSFLQGTGGQMGAIGLQGLATQQSGEQIGAARATELAQMQGQAGGVRGLLGLLSPESATQIGNAQQEAQRAYQSARGLTAEENRMATQMARESFAQRGMLNSNASVAGEALSREGVMAAKRNEAAARGATAFDMGQEFYARPGLQLLNGLPQSYQAGQQQVGIGLGSIGAGTPQLFNMDAALGVGAADRQNQFNAASANAQAKAAQNNANTQAAAAVAAAALMAFSDRRLKKDIHKIGKTPGGHNKYLFKYKNDPAEIHRIGVMAQEVEKKQPSAVKTIGGFKAVDYSKIK